MTSMPSGHPSRWSTLRRRAMRVRLDFEISIWRQGWIWPVVALLAIIAGVAALSAHLDLQRDSAELRQDEQLLRDTRLAAEQQAMKGRGANVEINARATSNSEKQAALMAVLGPRSLSAEQVQRLYEIAGQSQVAIAQADFQVSGQGNAIERLQIDIPTKAGYPQLRRFLQAMLIALPNASLDKLSFKRNQVGDAQVEARVYLSLWFAAPAQARSGDIVPTAHTMETRP